MTKIRPALLLSIGCLLGSFGFLYRNVITKLVYDWGHDDNYSHGFLIVPIALYLAWERRDRLTAALRRPSALGLVVIIGSLLTLVAGILGAELFLSRVSIVGLVAGAVLFVLGWEHFRILFFPIAFLLLMVPIEVLSYLTRPVSLSIRLFANMMAGHTMLKVFAAFTVMLGIFGVAPLAINVALTGFEFLVAFLQAYVFTVLTCIYLNDAIHLH